MAPSTNDKGQAMLACHEGRSDPLELVAEKLVSLFAAANADERETILRVLRYLGPNAASAVPLLTSLLNGEYYRLASWALAEIGEAARPAANALQRRIRMEWCDSAAVALVLIGAVDAVDDLRSAAKTVNPYWLDEWRYANFHERGREASAAVPVLIRLAEAPEFEFIRPWILEFIGRFSDGGGLACNALVRWLDDPRWEEFRYEVTLGLAYALAAEPDPDPRWTGACARHGAPTVSDPGVVCWADRWNSPYGIGFGGWRDEHPIFEEVVGPLIESLKLGGRIEQSIALESFKTLGPSAKAAVPALLELYQTAPTKVFAWAAVRVLGAIGPPAAEAVPLLLDIVLHRAQWQPDEIVCSAAASALEWIRAPGAARELLDGFGSSQESAHRQRLLSALHGCLPEAAGEIKSFMDSFLFDPRAAEDLATICWLKDYNDEQLLWESIVDAGLSHPHLRRPAAIWLTQNIQHREGERLDEAEDPRVHELLEWLLQDEDESKRTSAWIALANLGDSKAVAPLIGLLNSLQSRSWRCSILQALARPDFANDEVVEAFRAALVSDEEWLRRGAKESFMGLGPAAFPLLHLVEEVDRNDESHFGTE
jgi:HEAT repeat protein